MATPISLSQLDSDASNLIANDIPKTIVISGTTVTGLIESIDADNKALYGALDYDLTTRVWVQKSVLSGVTLTKGSTFTADGILKRAESINFGLDSVFLVIDCTDPN